VARRVPVLRQDDVVEAPEEGRHERDDLVPLPDPERSPGAEVVLDVDDQQRVALPIDLAA